MIQSRIISSREGVEFPRTLVRSLMTRSFLLLLPAFIFLLLPRSFAQSPLPKVMEHSFEEIKAQFDAWQIPPGDHPIETLLEENRLEYDQKGAITQNRRRIWRLKSKQISEFGILSAEFAPWYENQPKVTARVFDPNGREFRLSKDDITVSPAGSADQGILTDRMTVQAALPGLKVGSIVEEIVESTQREAFCEQGTWGRFSWDSFYPGLFLSIEIDAPESNPVTILFRPQIPPNLKTEEKTIAGRRTQRWFTNQRSAVSFESIEPEIPRNEFQQQVMIVNTGTQWRLIAEFYSKLVDQRLESDALEEIAKEILSQASEAQRSTVEGKVHCLSQWVRQNIRYTGVALGNAAIVPARTTTVIARRFGDCKDQSSLLVGLLRASGVPAEVALVNSTSTRFPIPELPCLNAFNHAIVVVRQPTGNWWIDPTDPGSTPQCIPIHLQGRFALIANPSVDDLTTIESQGIERNWEHGNQTISINTNGTSTIEMESMQSGYFAAESRSNAFGYSLEEESKRLQDYYKKAAPTIEASLKYRSDPGSDESTFIRKIEMRGVPLEQVDQKRLRYDLTFLAGIQQCSLFYLVQTDERGVNEPRKYPAECLVPFRWTRNVKLIPPPGYRLKKQSQNHAVQIGIVELKSTVEELEDGSMSIQQSLEVKHGLLSPEELSKLSTLASELGAGDHPLNFSTLIETGSSVDGSASSALLEQLKSNRQQWLKNPNGDSAYAYVCSLVQIGQVDEAREVAIGMMEQYPQEGMVHCAYAFALLHDIVGRELCFGADARKAEKECRKAIELSPQAWQPYYLLSILIDVDDDGVHQDTPESLKAQLELFEMAESKGSDTQQIIDRQIIILIRVGRVDEAIALATKKGMDTELTIAKVVKAARASRWLDVAAIRDRISNQRERDILGITVEQIFLADQDYETGARVMFIMKGVSDREVEERIRPFTLFKTGVRPKNPNESPETVAREFLFRIIAQGNHPESWPDIVANSGAECRNANLLSNITYGLRSNLNKVGADSDRLFDAAYQYPIRVEGDDNQGYLVRIKASIDCEIGVIKQGDQYKVLLTGRNLQDYGLLALKFLEDGKPELAIRWIDWILRGLPDGVVLDPETGHPVKRFWSASRKKTTETIRTAIEMLLVSAEWTPQRSQFLHEALDAEKSAFKRQWILKCILMNDRLKGPELESELKFCFERFPDSALAKMRWATYQSSLGNIEPLRDQIQQIVNPNDLNRIRLSDKLDYYQKNYAELLDKRIARLEKQQQNKEPLIDSWNSCIWVGLFIDNVRDEWLEDYRSSLRLVPDPAALHTLACAEAHVGQLDRAVGTLQRLIDLRANRIEDLDYWILGRIAEQCDLPTRARYYYAKVEPDQEPGSTYQLAQHRIAILDQRADSSGAPTSDSDSPAK